MHGPKKAKYMEMLWGTRPNIKEVRGILGTSISRVG